MLLIRIWNYIRGYVIIIVEGYFLEKFINICTHRQLFLWDVRRTKNCTMTMKISIRAFKLIRPVARKTNCRVRILKKRGLPFFTHRYKKRKVFVLGAFIFVFLLMFLSSFIWVVDIEGNSKIETGVIMQNLSICGIKPGVWKYGINTDKAVNNMMLDIKQLGWIGISIHGTKVKVELSERILPPQIIDKSIPCNIVAKRDGVIKSLVILDGFEAVKVTETVKSGQILISGSIPIKNKPDEFRVVHAMGNAFARTWYEGKSIVRTVLVENERTGEKKNKYTISILGKRFTLPFGNAKFEQFENVQLTKRLEIGKDFVLPFEVIIDTQYEYKTIEKQIDIDQAKIDATEAANKEANDSIPLEAKIIKKNLIFKEEEDGKLSAIVTIECLEDIGIQQKIGGE